MSKQATVSRGSYPGVPARQRAAFSMPQAVGAAALATAAWFAWWLSANDFVAGRLPLRTLFLMVPCSLLIAATLLLFEDR
jgi:hypothetical protein